MKKLLLILSLILLSNNIYASSASVKIILDAHLSDVVVSSTTSSFNLDDSADDFYIKEVSIKISDLKVNPMMVTSIMKSKKFLDGENYSEIYVRNLSCDKHSGECNLDLTIKDNERHITARMIKSSNSNQVKFNISLSDFSISRRVGLWSIKDTATVSVNIFKL